MRCRLSLLLLIAGFAMRAGAVELEDLTLVDLSHRYDDSTVYWPTSPTDFELRELAFGDSGAGYFYSAFSVCTPEHGGTHLDAPLHFARDGADTASIPLDNLVAPAFVIDIRDKAAADRNYRLTAADVTAFEARHGRITEGAIVLVRTDWSRRWPNALDYLGDDTPGDASKLSFPGIAADAAALLAEDRAVAVIGIDTASIDYGPSTDFIAHRIAAEAGAANLENLSNLDRLPPTGAIVIALPMKIGGGSGGPARVIAMVPDAG